MVADPYIDEGIRKTGSGVSYVVPFWKESIMNNAGVVSPRTGSLSGYFLPIAFMGSAIALCSCVTQMSARVPELLPKELNPPLVSYSVQVRADTAEKTVITEFTKQIVELGEDYWLKPGGILEITAKTPEALAGLSVWLSDTSDPTGTFSAIPSNVQANLRKPDGLVLSYRKLSNSGLVFHDRIMWIRSTVEGVDIKIRLYNQVTFLSAIKYPVLYVFNGSLSSFTLQNFSPSLSFEAIKLNMPYKNLGYMSCDGMVSITPSVSDLSTYTLAIGAYIDIGGWGQVGFLIKDYESFTPTLIVGLRPDSLVSNIIKSSMK